MKNKFFLVISTILFTLITSLHAQNCTVDSTGLTPITDLVGAFYQGYEGGLYVGSNTKPAQHVDNLTTAILNIQPLNTLGSPDNHNGKIVLLSIGASNPKTEFHSFQTITDTFSLINPYLEIVNGCQGGKGLQKIIDTTDGYWKNVSKLLTASGVTNNQVQVIWLEEENTQSKTVDFPNAPIELMADFKVLFSILLQNYPNLQVCYLTARGYAGYVDNASTAGSGLRQPRDYFHGWAMKWLIENQIVGDSTLEFRGPNRKAPLLDWSAYLWADGKNLRKDGLSWICPTDTKTDDGLHWSPIGNDKAGRAIFQRFYLDENAKKWFLNNPTSGLFENTVFNHIKIYPNPCIDNMRITTDIIGKFDVYIYNTMGQLVKTERDSMNGDVIHHNLPNGIYHLMLNTQNHSFAKPIKFSVYR